MEIAVIGALVRSESVTELARELIHSTKQEWVSARKRLVESRQGTTDARVRKTAVSTGCSAIGGTVRLGACKAVIALEAVANLLSGVANTVTRAVLRASKDLT